MVDTAVLTTQQLHPDVDPETPCKVLMLEESGLHRYVDARYLQQEIAEANDMTQEEMDQAARELLRHNYDPDSPAGGSPGSADHKLPYYDHLGGYSMQDMRDYNQYSQQDDLMPHHKPGYTEDISDDADDQMVYVTTL